MPSPSSFLLGSWKVLPDLNRVEREGEIRSLEPKVMDLLVYLSRHPGEVLSKERLLQAVWPDTFVGEGVLTTAISQIRKALEDDSEKPSFIETFPKRGYRLVAPVRPATLPTLPVSRTVRFSRVWWIVAGGALLVLLLVATRLGTKEASSADAGAGSESLWVLIANFENRTGEDLLDGTVEFALEQELANSTFVKVVPGARIGDVLRLMEKPPETAVDAALAREICLRDGEINALVSGRIEKVGSEYRLGLSLVEPADGAVVASTATPARTHEDILNAVPRLALWARQSLGERRLQGSFQRNPVEQATTTSLRALYLYSQAVRLLQELLEYPLPPSDSKRRWAAIDALFRDAVREDPNFAAAHLGLAWSSLNVQGYSEEVAAEAERAVALAQNISEWERHYIVGSCHMIRWFSGESVQTRIQAAEKAIAEFEAVLALRPYHYWALRNLALFYCGHESPFNWTFPCDRMAGSTCAAYQVRFAQLRPKAFGPNAAAAGALAIGRGDFEAADPFLKRAAESLEVQFEQGFQVAWIDLMPFHRAWVDNDPDTALKALGPAAGRLAAARGGQLWDYPWFLGSAYLTLGRLDQAREVLQWMRVPPQYGDYRHLWLALTAYVADRPDVLVEELREYARNPSPDESVGLILFARTGHLDQAESLLAGLRGCEGHLKAAQGEVALAKGDLATAVPLLQEACENPAGSEYFLAAESLANALQDSGRPSSAIAVLEQASLQKPHAYILSSFLWLRIRFQLARMYRLTGQPEKALQIETELRKLLKYADPDHPLVMALQRL